MKFNMKEWLALEPKVTLDAMKTHAVDYKPDFPQPSLLVFGAGLPLEENVAHLKEWLLRQFLSSTFNTDRYPLWVMQGSPHCIHLKEVV
ncbi:hypothetical protein E2C01_058237 [Portunus trituberculatus]|uniref:Uncharacterized protein n=1 Tax=Portunus trituberculatus TaxID=210409 RepID=A0A5B7H2N6_PORTR|nr:hypothetical protein [Portunus trituberculatus]